LYLNQGVDSRIAIAEGGGGNVYAVDAQIDGAAGADKVVDAAATLGRKIEYRCAAGLSVRNEQIWREFVGGVDETTRRLEPRLDAARMAEKIPAQNDGRNAGAHVSAAAQRPCESGAVGIKEVGIRILRGSESKPKRHDVGAVFELAGEDSMADDRCEDLARLKASGEEAVVVPVAESVATVQEWAVFPAQVLANLVDGINVDGGAECG